MLIREFVESILTEKNLTPKEMLKHDYLDQLINKIENGEELRIEPSEVEKVGMANVVLDPSAADLLRDWRKSNSPSKSPMLPIANSDQTISTSALSKSNVRSGLNVGIMSEGVLGAALVAKFLKLGKEITFTDVTRVLNGIKIAKNSLVGASVTGAFNDKIKHKDGSVDKIKFELRLANTEFEYLTKATSNDATIGKLLSSAVLFVNSSTYGIPKAISMITENADGNQIDVVTDGVSDNKGTKADLTLKINGKVIDLISLKAGSVRQFGQVSGGHNFAKLIDDFFEVKLGNTANELIELTRAETKDKEAVTRITNQNYDVIRYMFQTLIIPSIEKQTKTPAAKRKFIEKLVDGIGKHLTGDKNIHIVKLHTTGGGGYTVLKLNKKKLPGVMEGLDFSTVYFANSNTLKILAVPTDVKSKMYQELDGKPTLLIQLRSMMQSESYIRNIVEMGPMLEDLIVLEKHSEPLVKAKAAPKTPAKLKARFEPEPAPSRRAR